MRNYSKIAGSAAITLCLLVPAISAKGQEHTVGLRIAEKHCVKCHAIGPTGDSRHAAAPPFRLIATKMKVDDLQEALAEGIVVGHEAMPEFELQPDEIAELLAYIKSLAPTLR
jgi:cytochrome c